MTKQTFIHLILAQLLLLLCSCGPTQQPPLNSGRPQRIISMAPSITESLCAVGAEAQLVGVTKFCRYPESVKQLPRAGGYTDTNYEMIIALRPDLVVLLDEHEQARDRFDELGIRYLEIDTSNLAAIMASLRTIGEATDNSEQAEAVIASLQQHMDQLRQQTAGLTPRSALISIGRNMGTGGLSDVYLAGSGTLYDELLQIIHARNVYQGPVPYAKISREGLQRMNPDVIIDLVPDLDQSTQLTGEQVRADWFTLQGVNAVRNKEVHVFGGDYVCVPGPRFIRVLNDIAHAIYPELLQQAENGSTIRGNTILESDHE